jgi:hypothetical protein
MALGVTLEHVLGPAPDFVDIADLPGRVVEERHRGRLNEQVVMVGGATHERGDTDNLIADLETDSLLEEALRRLEVGAADDDVT